MAADPVLTPTPHQLLEKAERAERNGLTVAAGLFRELASQLQGRR